MAEGPPPLRVLGRYALYGEIAFGGMATVHYGRLTGPVGFARTVAIKRLHPQFARDPDFVSMFFDEARLAARIRHPNVVPTLDIVQEDGELYVVMEYVQGESLSRLARLSRERKLYIPPSIIAPIMAGVLHGLHAAHEATNERGEPLGLVHRDVSPHNVMVGVDGASRVLDFGVAKASGRVHSTRGAQIKGKLAYMAPEQVRGQVSRAIDVYAAGVVLWEALTLRRLFRGENDAEVLAKVLSDPIPAPSSLVPNLPPALDAVVATAVARDPAARFATARDMARAIERTIPFTPASDIGEWVEGLAHDALRTRATKIAEIESASFVVSGPGLAAGLPPPAPSEAKTLIAPPQAGALPPANLNVTRVPPSPGDAPLGATLVSPAQPRARAAQTAPQAAHGAHLGVMPTQPLGLAPTQLAGAPPFPSQPPPGDEAIATQLSSGSMTGSRVDAVPPAPPRYGLAVLAGAVPAAILAIGAYLIIVRVMPPSPQAAALPPPPFPPPPVAVLPVASASAAASPPPVAPSPAPSDTAPADSASATTPPPAPPATAAVKPASTEGTSSATPAPHHHTAPKPDCSPPYTVDSAGDKHYKRECLN